MQTRDQALLDGDRRLQRGGLRRDAAAARLAARAPRGGAAPSSGRSRCRSPSQPKPVAAAKVERAALRRGAARRGRGARRAAARLPRPRAQAGLVGVLRPARDDARGAASRTPSRSAGSSSPASRSRYEALEGLHAHATRRRSTSSAGRGPFDPATGKSPGEIVELDRDARRLVLKRGPSFEDVPLPRGAHPRPAVRHRRPGGRADAARPLAARRRPSLPGARVGAAPRAVRRARSRRPTSRR